MSCFVVLLFLYVAGAFLGGALKYLSVVDHFGEMAKGIIDTQDIVYFLSLVVLSLFLTHRAVEAARQSR